MTSAGAFFHFRPFDHMDMLQFRTVMMITGETVHSRYFSEDAFDAALGPKELVVVPGAGHVALYDRVDLIPWDKLAERFTKTLAA
jgi:uncharacterized protein